MSYLEDIKEEEKELYKKIRKLNREQDAVHRKIAALSNTGDKPDPNGSLEKEFQKLKKEEIELGAQIKAENQKWWKLEKELKEIEHLESGIRGFELEKNSKGTFNISVLDKERIKKAKARLKFLKNRNTTTEALELSKLEKSEKIDYLKNSFIVIIIVLVLILFAGLLGELCGGGGSGSWDGGCYGGRCG